MRKSRSVVYVCHPTARAPRWRSRRCEPGVGDEAGIVFSQLCNALEPRTAYLSSASRELRELTQALRQQLRADHEAAITLCHKVGLRSCKELREAKEVSWSNKFLTAADLALLGTLGSVLPALEHLALSEPAAGPDGVQRLAVGT